MFSDLRAVCGDDRTFWAFLTLVSLSALVQASAALTLYPPYSADCSAAIRCRRGRGCWDFWH